MVAESFDGNVPPEVARWLRSMPREHRATIIDQGFAAVDVAPCPT